MSNSLEITRSAIMRFAEAIDLPDLRLDENGSAAANINDWLYLECSHLEKHERLAIAADIAALPNQVESLRALLNENRQLLTGLGVGFAMPTKKNRLLIVGSLPTDQFLADMLTVFIERIVAVAEQMKSKLPAIGHGSSSPAADDQLENKIKQV